MSQFALRDILPAFLDRYPKVRVVEHVTDVLVDIVAEGFDLALRGHSAPLPNSTLVQRTIAHVPWFLFAGSSYLGRTRIPKSPEDLVGHSTIARVRDSAWRLQRPDAREVVIPIEPRFACNDMVTLKQSACAGLGIVALPGYVCWPEVRTGELRQVLPEWIAVDSTVTALMPYRHGLLPAVRALVDYLATEFPKAAAFRPHSWSRANWNGKLGLATFGAHSIAVAENGRVDHSVRLWTV
jgi:DNA-binding transcriptional LysR family regulator